MQLDLVHETVVSVPASYVSISADLIVPDKFHLLQVSNIVTSSISNNHYLDLSLWNGGVEQSTNNAKGKSYLAYIRSGGASLGGFFGTSGMLKMGIEFINGQPTGQIRLGTYELFMSSDTGTFSAHGCVYNGVAATQGVGGQCYGITDSLAFDEIRIGYRNTSAVSLLSISSGTIQLYREP